MAYAGYRAVVVMEDATVSLVEKTANVWHRVEGLASIQDALFVNLAKAGGTEDLEHSNVVMRFVHRTIFQVLRLGLPAAIRFGGGARPLGVCGLGQRIRVVQVADAQGSLARGPPGR